MSERWRRIMSGEDASLAGRSLRAGAAAAEPVYAGVVALRNRAFDRGWRRVVRLARPTISVGNITAGGTGKTPMVAHLCRWLLSNGHQPAVLTRGYRGGDEPLQLSSEFGPQVLVAANPDRALGARQALIQRPQISVFVLDDGFQRRQVDRLLDLVLVDATCPLGFGRVLPRGLLRERPESLRRADAVLVTRCDQVGVADLAAVDDMIATHHGRPPIAHARHAWTGWRTGDRRQPLSTVTGRRIAAAVGLGNPAAFEASLREQACQVLSFSAKPDHHRYTTAELSELMARSRAAGAEVVVTSEKDYVKWQPLLNDLIEPLPVWRPVLDIQFVNGWGEISDLLKARLSAPVD